MYACWGSVKTSATLPVSTIRPRCMTMTRSQMPATTARSWVMKRSPAPTAPTRSEMRSSMCFCTVTSSAVVGSSQMSRRGEFASAIASMTRCRWPPESWCG